MEPVMWRWSAETLPTSTKIMKMRETTKRKEVKREDMRRASVAVLMVDFEGGWFGDGFRLDSCSGEDAVER